MVLCDAFQHARLSLNTAGSLCDTFRCMFTGGDFAVCSKNLEGSLFGTAKPRTSLRKPVFSCIAQPTCSCKPETSKKNFLARAYASERPCARSGTGVILHARDIRHPQFLLLVCHAFYMRAPLTASSPATPLRLC